MCPCSVLESSDWRPDSDHFSVDSLDLKETGSRKIRRCGLELGTSYSQPSHLGRETTGPVKRTLLTFCHYWNYNVTLCTLFFWAQRIKIAFGRVVLVIDNVTHCNRERQKWHKYIHTSVIQSRYLCRKNICIPCRLNVFHTTIMWRISRLVLFFSRAQSNAGEFETHITIKLAYLKIRKRRRGKSSESHPLAEWYPAMCKMCRGNR